MSLIIAEKIDHRWKWDYCVSNVSRKNM